MFHLRKAYFNILEIRLHACVHVCVFRLFNSLICCFRALGNRIHTSNLKRDHLIERIINWRQVYSLSEGIEENLNNPLALRDSTWWRKTIGVRDISNTDLEFTGESVTGPIRWQDSSLNSPRTKLVMASWKGLVRRNWFQRLPPRSWQNLPGGCATGPADPHCIWGTGWEDAIQSSEVSLALSLLWHTLLTKLNMVPTGKGEIFMCSNSNITKQGAEGWIWSPETIRWSLIPIFP